MKIFTEESLENIATQVAAEIFATAVVHTKYTWINELEAISNITISQTLRTNISFECVFFSIYYLNARFKNEFNNEQKNAFDRLLLEKLIWYISNAYTAENDKSRDISEDIKELFEVFLPPKLEEYACFNRGNIGINLKENLLNYFSKEDISISETTIDNYVNLIIKSCADININTILEETF